MATDTTTIEEMLHCAQAEWYDIIIVIIIITRKLCYRKDERVHARYINGSNESLLRYGHSKLSKMAACH